MGSRWDHDIAARRVSPIRDARGLRLTARGRARVATSGWWYWRNDHRQRCCCFACVMVRAA